MGKESELIKAVQQNDQQKLQVCIRNLNSNLSCNIGFYFASFFFVGHQYVIICLYVRHLLLQFDRHSKRF